jgi:hypothetical protein
VKKRNPLIVSVLCAVSLGFYYSYWLYKTWGEVNNKVEYYYRIPSPVIPIALHLIALLNIVFNAFQIIGDYSLLNSGNLQLLLILITGVLAVGSISYWFSRFCRAIKSLYPSTSLGMFDYPVVLIFHYFLLFFVWAGLAQNKINKLAELQGHTVTDSSS